MMFSLAVALGCDLFDSASYALYAKDGRYMTARGTYHLNKLQYLPCSCPVCSSLNARELFESENREELLARHNLYVTFEEIREVKQAILEGSLWELVNIAAGRIQITVRIKSGSFTTFRMDRKNTTPFKVNIFLQRS